MLYSRKSPVSSRSHVDLPKVAELGHPGADSLPPIAAAATSIRRRDKNEWLIPKTFTFQICGLGRCRKNWKPPINGRPQCWGTMTAGSRSRPRPSLLAQVRVEERDHPLADLL